MRTLLAPALVLLLASIAIAAPTITSQRVSVSVDAESRSISVVQELQVARDGGGVLLVALDASMTIETASVDLQPIERPRRVPLSRERAVWEIDIPRDGPAACIVILQARSDPSGSVHGLAAADGAFDGAVVAVPPTAAWYARGDGAAGLRVTLRDPAGRRVVGMGSAPEGVPGEVRETDGPAPPQPLVLSPWEPLTATRFGSTVTVHAPEGQRTTLAEAAWRALDAVTLVAGSNVRRIDVVLGTPEQAFVAPGLVVVCPEELAFGELLDARLRHAAAAAVWGGAVLPGASDSGCVQALAEYVAGHMARERASLDRARWFRIVTARADALESRGASPVRLVHALRREVGDEAFREGLRHLARTRAGRDATWADLTQSLSAAGGRNLAAELSGWRSGPPFRVALTDLDLAVAGGRLRLDGRLVRESGADAIRMGIPLDVELVDGTHETVVVEMQAAATPFRALLPGLPLFVRIDPDVHTPRRLAPRELPPCLATALADSPPTLLHGPGLADVARAIVPEADVVTDGDDAFPAGDVVIVVADVADARALLGRSSDADALLSARGVRAWRRHDGTESGGIAVVIVAPPAQLAALAHDRAPVLHAAALEIDADGRVEPRVVDDDFPRIPALPDVRTMADAGRSAATVKRLLAIDAPRTPGGDGEAQLAAAAIEELRLAGWHAETLTTSYFVRERRGGPALADAGGDVEGAVPLVASPPTGVAVAGPVAADPGDDLRGGVLVVDLAAAADDVASFARGIGELARSGGALALVLRLPPDPATHLLSDSLTAADAPEGADRTAFAARAQARWAQRDGARDLPLPTLLAPSTWNPSGEVRVDVAWAETTISSTSVVARLDGSAPPDRRAVVFAADLDEPAAPTGVAALVETASVLAMHRGLLSREVVLVAAGGGTHGQRGRHAVLGTLWRGESPQTIVAVGRVGDSGTATCRIEGDAETTRVIGAAMAQASVPPEPADSPAAPSGPAVARVTSYGAADEGGALPSPVKIARVGRGLGLSALALSSTP